VSENSRNETHLPWWGLDRFGWSQQLLDGGVVVVYLAGELDMATAADLGRRLMRVAESGDAATIVLDLSDVCFMDAHSAGLIVNAWTTAKSRGRELCVDGLHGIPARVFSVLGLEHTLARRTWEADPRGDVDGRSGGNGGAGGIAARHCSVGGARETR